MGDVVWGRAAGVPAHPLALWPREAAAVERALDALAVGLGLAWRACGGEALTPVDRWWMGEEVRRG